MRTEPSVKVQLIDGLYEAKKGQPIGKFEFIGRKMLITRGVWEYLDGDRNCDDDGNFPILTEICSKIRDFAKDHRLSPVQYMEVDGETVVYMDSPKQGLGIMLPEEAKCMFSGLPGVQYREIFCSKPRI